MSFYRVHVQLIDDELKVNHHLHFDFIQAADAISFADDAFSANFNYNINVELVDSEDILNGPEWRAI